MKQRAGLLLLMAVMLLPAWMEYGRGVLFNKKSPPAISVGKPDGLYVELGAGFPEPGIHQFIDGTTLRGAIEMTLGCGAASRLRAERPDAPLQSGESLVLCMEHNEIAGIIRKWMAAEKRMLLGIPLRPEAMSADDWLALPGIGPKLAARIEADRQKNGDFSSLEDLARVSGIGASRLATWEKYFLAPSNFDK